MATTLDTVRLREIVDRALENYHRALIVVEDNVDILPKIIREYTKLRGGSYTLLLSAKYDRDEVDWLDNVLSCIKDYVDDKVIKWDYVSFKTLEKIMGTTWDFLIADFRSDFRPNDLGRLIEVVRGGGLAVLVTPDLDKWGDMRIPFHKDMVTEPYTMEDVRPIYIRHIVHSLIASPGVYILRRDGYLEGELPPRILYQRRELSIPKDSTIDLRIYEMALTQDQVDAIYAIDRGTLRDRPVVITADRGRGKSVALGLGIAGVMIRDYRSDKKIKVLLTAPEPVNVREVFNFARRVFRGRNIKYNVKKAGEYIVELNSEVGQLKYVSPIDVFRERCDYLFVDEASGIPVNLLEGYIERFRFGVFSTTLHGYEGAGRGFQVRFLPMIKRMSKGRVIEVSMSEPIRYAYNDPVENWLFKALLLDSDPAHLDEEFREDIDLDKLRYVKIDLEDWLFNKTNLFKEYVGIYIYAHYRNRPNDIMLLCDAPHHFARCLIYRDTVVNSLHLALEGDLSDDAVRRSLAGMPPSGHLIPTVLIRYFPLLKDFSKLKGIRVVRIATHPEIMNRGIGSHALKGLISEARKMGMDWVGASFGATVELLNFWFKNGFIPVYLSPIKNPVSGEFSTIVVNPLNREARDYVKKFRYEFKKLFVDSMVDTYFVLDEVLAYNLLSLDRWSINYDVTLKGNSLERLKEYCMGALHYGGAVDAIREVVKAHFIRSPDRRVPIPRKYEYAIISKVLQARSWEKVAQRYDVDKDELIARIREYVGKMRLSYVKGV